MSHRFSPIAPGSDRCWCGSPKLARAHFPGSAGADSLEGAREVAQEVRPTAEEFEAAGEPGILVQRWTKPEALRPHRMVEDSLGEWLHWKDHIAALAAVEGQRDGFLAEVERLRTRERHLETEVGHLHDDVRRLRTCLEDADEQRDALADALQKLLRLEPAITTARNGGPTSEAWCRWEEAKIAATKALRKAGRP